MAHGVAGPVCPWAMLLAVGGTSKSSFTFAPRVSNRSGPVCFSAEIEDSDHARLRLAPLRVTVAARGPSSFLRNLNGKLILALRRNPGLDGLNHGPGTCAQAPGPSREAACTVDSVQNRMSRSPGPLGSL